MNQLSLFDDKKSDHEIPADLVVYHKNFIEPAAAHLLLQQLISDLPWQQTERLMYGKKIITPRLTVWFGDPRANYSVSGKPAFPLPWTNELLDIKKRVDEISGVSFNTVLLNYYRDGNDSVAWHSDNDGIPGRNKIVASVSLGQSRIFEMRAIEDHSQKYSILLDDGSYLLMKGNFQDEWQHRIPRSSKHLNPRVNLTFRIMPAKDQ
jgi:alkylated DNA repair dioxygenase AlkB